MPPKTATLSERDAARGITNVETRYGEQIASKLTGNQAYARAKRQKNLGSQNPINTVGLEDLSTITSASAVQRSLKKSEILNGVQKKVRVVRSAWSSIYICCLFFVFQFIFGFISLIFLGAAYGVETKTLISWINVFIDVGGSFEKVGMLFWTLSALVAFTTFCIFSLWFYIMKINPYHSIVSTFLTFVLLSLSLFPAANLAPWLVLWIIMVHSETVFSKN